MTFRSNATKIIKTKQRFAWWHIMVFAALLLLLIVMFFPKQSMIQSILDTDKPSQLSLAYLNNLSHENPQDIEIKMSLANQEILLGNIDKASAIINPYLTLSPKNATEWHILWLHYRITETKTYEKKNKVSIASEQYLKSLLDILIQSPILNGDQAASLAKASLAADDPKLALAYYQLAIKRGINGDVEFYQQAAQTALFVSDYQSSASFYILAMQKSHDKKTQQKYFLKALNSLRQGGLYDAAFKLADANMVGFEDDKATLIYMADLALAANRPDVAEKYITKALELKYKK